MNVSKSICIVCIANFCRSPVAEIILKNKFPEFDIISAGIAPHFDSTGMDIRSKNYLLKKGFKFSHHQPKQITTNVVKNYDYILALDLIVLRQLNKIFPKNAKKFKLLAFNNPTKILKDPFKMSDAEYEVIMDNILDVCNDFYL